MHRWVTLATDGLLYFHQCQYCNKARVSWSTRQDVDVYYMGKLDSYECIAAFELPEDSARTTEYVRR